jgi:hypothetical protein
MLDERRQGALGERAADGRSAGDDDKQEETDQYGKKRTEAVAMRDLVAVGQQADCRRGESLRKVLQVQAGLAHVRPPTRRRACR